MHPILRPATSQDVAIGAASAACTNAFNAVTTIVRLVATSACYVAFAAAPTATKPGGHRLAPNFPEYFLVSGGEKVAVIEDTTAGTLTVTEMTR
jgi:hypothetical protein